MRYFLQFCFQFLANERGHISYWDCEVRTNSLKPFLNCPATKLFVSYFPTLMLDNPLDLCKHWVTCVNTLAESCLNGFLNFCLESWKIWEHCS